MSLVLMLFSLNSNAFVIYDARSSEVTITMIRHDVSVCYYYVFRELCLLLLLLQRTLVLLYAKHWLFVITFMV